ncbi:Ig domain-containing protein [Ensifer adhaerens]|uniref:Ig domain-containing protein n=1 Tax=Ensifer adhaerens TaxID=106592 RepID=UPI000DD5BAF3
MANRFSASNGTSPCSYAITAGSLPAGLSLDGETGALHGTPTAVGNSGFTVTATDRYGATGAAVYAMSVVPQLLPPAYGTANAVGITITYTPSADYSGPRRHVDGSNGHGHRERAGLHVHASSRKPRRYHGWRRPPAADYGHGRTGADALQHRVGYLAGRHGPQLSTDELTGPLNAKSEEYTFAIRADDGNGAT